MRTTRRELIVAAAIAPAAAAIACAVPPAGVAPASPRAAGAAPASSSAALEPAGPPDAALERLRAYPIAREIEPALVFRARAPRVRAEDL